jgi:hypothetical protein
VRRCPQVASEWDDHLEEGTRPDQAESEESRREAGRRSLGVSDADGDTGNFELPAGLRPGEGGEEPDDGDDEAVPSELPTLIDHEDETLLLLLYQRLRGPLMTHKQREAIEFEHILVDEAQDLSPVELSVVLSVTTSALHHAGRRRRTALAWTTLHRLERRARAAGSFARGIEPLKPATAPFEIISTRTRCSARSPEEMGKATRSGTGRAVPFRTRRHAVGFSRHCAIARGEPRVDHGDGALPGASRLYFKGLVNAEVPNVRRRRSGLPVQAGRRRHGRAPGQGLGSTTSSCSRPTPPRTRPARRAPVVLRPRARRTSSG